MESSNDRQRDCASRERDRDASRPRTYVVAIRARRYRRRLVHLSDCCRVALRMLQPLHHAKHEQLLAREPRRLLGIPRAYSVAIARASRDQSQSAVLQAERHCFVPLISLMVCISRQFLALPMPTSPAEWIGRQHPLRHSDSYSGIQSHQFMIYIYAAFQFTLPHLP